MGKNIEPAGTPLYDSLKNGSVDVLFKAQGQTGIIGLDVPGENLGWEAETGQRR